MFVCFPELFEPTNETHKIQILTKNQLFYQNYEKSTNMNFFHVSIDQSYLWAINYLVYEFYDHTTHFEDNMRFWIWKKKRKKNIIIFSITSKYLKYNAKKIIIISKKNYNNFNFYNFKISRFAQNEMYDNEIRGECSLWSKLKMRRWKLEKK